MRILFACILCFCPCLGACGSAQQTANGPRDAVKIYLDAVRGNKPKRAYRFLSDALQKKMSEADFQERWKHLRPELLDQAKAMEARIRKPVDITARVAYASGTRAGLRYVDKQWRIDTGVSVAFQTATPIAAIKAFMHAVERGTYKAAMKFLSRSVRESVDRDISERIRKLRQWMKADNEIEVTGNRARIKYGAGRYKIELVNEDGQWKVLDFN